MTTENTPVDLDEAEKVRENKLRRMAARQGLRLEKSRTRDWRFPEFGTYRLVDPFNNTVVAYGYTQNGYGMTLDEIKKALSE